MSSVKISQLTESSNLNTNPAHSYFVTVDSDTNTTYKINGKNFGKTLYANNALYVGTGGTQLTNVVAQLVGTDSSFTQISQQNINSGGSADFVITADNGTNASYYVDLGMNGSTFSDPTFSSMSKNDGYLFIHGSADHSGSTGNLVMGTVSVGANIVFIAGGLTSSDIVGNINKNSFNFFKDTYVTGNVSVNNVTTSNSFIFSDGTRQLTAANVTVLNANTAGVNTYSYAAFTKANTAVQNTAVIQLQTVQLSGNLIANSVGQGIFVDNFTSNNATFTKVVLGNLSSNTISINDTTGVVNANTIIANTFVYGSATANAMVTQLSSKSTAVTANGISGQITMNNAALAGQGYVTFTVNNSYVKHVNDIPFVAIQNGVTTPNPYQVCVGGVAVGSFNISVYNSDSGGGSSHSDAIVLNWGLIRVGN